MPATSPASDSTQEPQPPQVPLEIWERIIDQLRPPPSHRTPYILDNAESQRIHALMACSVVCRSWTHRAHTHLFSIARASSGQDLWETMETLRARPHLKPFITRLVATPPGWMFLCNPITDYLPIIPFLSMIPSTAEILLASVLWDPTTFVGAYDRGFCNFSVVRLELIGIIVPRLIDIFPFIHSFRNVAYIALVGIYIKREATEDEMALMQELASSRPMRRLTALEVGGESPGNAGIHLLGDGIEQLRLIVQLSDPITPSLEHYLGVLPRYRTLKALCITLEPWMTLKPPLAGSHDEGARVWGPIHRYTLRLLHSISSSLVRRLEMTLVPQHYGPEDTQVVDEPDDNPGEGATLALPYRYRHTRLGLLDTLFASDVCDTIHGSFPHLKFLDLVVHDNSKVHGQEWWRSEIEARLGLCAGIVHVEVHHSSEPPYDRLWNS